MRKIYLLLFMVFFFTEYSVIAQCTNTSSFGSATINTAGTQVTISTCSFAGEYSTISGAVSGQTLRFTSSIATDIITIRSGSSSGPVVAFGTTPLVFANTITGTLYAHWNTPACGSQSSCRTTTVQCTSCTPPPPPVNDLCAGAIPITCGQTLSGTTISSTLDNAGTCTVTNTQPGVWYTFTGYGGTATISLCGSSFDTKLSVYTGSCGAFTCVAGNDDFCSLQSQVSFATTVGTTYYILVHQFGTTGGAFNISATCTPIIITSGALTPFTTCSGTPSSEQSFSVMGVALTANLVVTAPAGFEVSTTSGSGFVGSVSLTPSGGVVNSTNIYVRVSSAASGTPAGNVVCSSTGATSQNIAASGTVNPQPTAYAVTGGGGYCSGGTGVAVGLSGSETGVDYQLYVGASPVGTAVAGTGAAISYGLQTTAGTYTVVATNATSSCTNNMTGSVTVSVNPLPTVFNVTGGGAYCNGGTGVTVGLDGSESGVNYQLYEGANPDGSPVAGTGAAISFGLETTAGTYSVVAINATTTCTNNMTGSVVVTINPVPAIGSALIQPTTCVSANGAIDITMSGAVGPYTYTWSTLDGSGLVAGQEDQSGLTVGQYTLVVSAANSCTATATFNLPGPGGCSVCPTIGTVTTNPVAVACLNSTVTLTASGLASMGVSYGINFKVSPTALADPYVGGSIIGTVPNAGLTGGGTIATTTTVAATAGSYFLYAVLTPVPLDPACRPSTVINVVVNPEPTVNPIANQIVCNNSPTAPVLFTGAVPGTIYNWTNNNTSIGLAASGTGDISAFTATNSGTTPVTATVTVTPSTSTVIGGGSPVTQTFNYTGSMQTFTVPTGVTSISIEAFGAAGASGSTGTAPGNGGLGGYATGTLAVTPGEVINIYVGGQNGYNGGGAAGTHVGTGAQTFAGNGGGASDLRQGGNGLANRMIVAAGGGGGGASNAGSCDDNNPSNGGAGGELTGINGENGTGCGIGGFGGTGATQVAGGLGGASGSNCSGPGLPGNDGTLGLSGSGGSGGNNGCVPNFQGGPGGGGGGGYYGGGGGGSGAGGSGGNGSGGAGGGGSSYIGGVTAGETTPGVQTGDGSILISYNVPATLTCTGAPITFTYTVNPTPNAVATPASQTICSANAISSIALSGNVSGTVFNWTRDNTASVTGIAANGSGDISGVLTNTTSAPVTVTFTITPTANGCPGTPITAAVLVNPTPNAVATPATQTICSGATITTIALTGAVSGTTFNWTRAGTLAITGVPVSGSGDISGAITNTSNEPVTVTFIITPTANGCPGTPITATVLVNPTPNAVATPASQTICSAGAITTIAITGNVSGTTYNWTRDNTATVTGIAASGSGNISGSLTNTTAAPVTVTFTITPTANGCPGAPITATVLVNPTPNAVGTPASQTVCTNAAITTIVLSGNVSGTTYSWTRNNTVAVTGLTSGSGNISGTLVNTTTVQQTVTFTIIPTANGCPGAPITATVIVNPTPTIVCPANIVVSNTPGVCGAAVTYPPATATGTPAPTITYSIASGSVFPVGVTTVTATATNACGSVSCTFTVRVNDVQPPVITCPGNITVNTTPGACNAVVSYTVTATDNCPGVTTALVSGLASGATFPMGTTTVTHRATDAAGNAVTCSFNVTVNDGQLPVISAQPANRTVCLGTTATFNVTATNAVSYQWQSWNGSVWSNITGATGATLTLTNVTNSMASNSYRVLVNGLCTVVTSNQATLYINPLPTVSIAATPLSSLLPGQYTNIAATTNPSGGSFVWYKNSVVVPGTGAVLGPLSVDEIGTYRTVYTDPNGCVATSGNVFITGQPSDNMWVYPNPNRGEFNVRYYNLTGETATLKVFDYLGQEVFNQILPQGIAYSSTLVSIPKAAAEVYIVKVVTSNGRELAAERIVVYH